MFKSQNPIVLAGGGGWNEKGKIYLKKFVEREKEWRGEPRGKIYKYFSPVISKSQDKLQTTSLEEFMN